MVTIPMEEGLSILSTSLLPPLGITDSPHSEMEKPLRVTAAGPGVSSPCPGSGPAGSLLGGAVGWAFISNTCGGRGAP